MPKRYFLVPLIGLFLTGKSNFSVYSFRSEVGVCHRPVMEDSIVTAKLNSIIKKYGEIDKPGFVFMAKYDSCAYYQEVIGEALSTPLKISSYRWSHVSSYDETGKFDDVRWTYTREVRYTNAHDLMLGARI